MNRLPFFFLLLTSSSLIGQSLQLEEFVVLEKYCPGDEFAIVRVLDQDGDEEFTYLWKHNGSTSNTLKIYKADFGKQFCVERHCPCGSVYESCFVFAPAKLPAVKGEIEKEDVTCYESDDGHAGVFVSGSGPFEYQWSSGERTRTISSLSAGKYQVTVTNALGCSQVLKTRIKQPRKLRLRPKIIAKNNLYAAVKLKISGGTPGYTLNGEKATKKLLFSTAKKKKYEFELKDAKGCIAVKSIILKKKYKSKRQRAMFTKLPKKHKKMKGRMKCPKI